MHDSDVREGASLSLTYGLLDILGSAIIAGDYKERPLPTEAELAKLHGVSRSVIREAVKMLVAKGLVGARPRWGTFVQPDEDWNYADGDVLRWLLKRRRSVGLLRQFGELRLAVEPEAAALAAERATPEQIAAIAAALTRMREAERQRYDDLDAVIAFHAAILRAVGNPFFLHFREVVSTALNMSRRFAGTAPGPAASLRDHAAVYEAIARGEAEAARAAMGRLIRDAPSGQCS
jgi:DNA-binding FadR family transcriptional regulator